MVHRPSLGTAHRRAGIMTGAPEPAGITLSDGELQAIETAMKATGADVIGPSAPTSSPAVAPI